MPGTPTPGVVKLKNSWAWSPPAVAWYSRVSWYPWSRRPAAGPGSSCKAFTHTSMVYSAGRTRPACISDSATSTSAMSGVTGISTVCSSLEATESVMTKLNESKGAPKPLASGVYRTAPSGEVTAVGVPTMADPSAWNSRPDWGSVVIIAVAAPGPSMSSPLMTTDTGVFFGVVSPSEAKVTRGRSFTAWTVMATTTSAEAEDASWLSDTYAKESSPK